MYSTKEEHTLNFRMIKPTEKFNFSEPLFNTTKLGLIGLSVYNSVIKVNRNNYQFLYASTVIDDSPIREPASPISERLSSNTNSNINTNTKSNTNSNSSSNPNTNTNTNTNKERAKPLLWQNPSSLELAPTQTLYLFLIIIIKESHGYIQLLDQVHMRRK